MLLIVTIGLALLGVFCLVAGIGIKKFSENSLNNPDSQFHQVWHEIDQTGLIKPIAGGLILIGLFFFSAAIAVGFASRGMRISPSLGIWIGILGAVLSAFGGFGYNLLGHPDDPRFSLIAKNVQRSEQMGDSVKGQRRKMAILVLIGIVLVFAGIIVYGSSF